MQVVGVLLNRIICLGYKDKNQLALQFCSEEGFMRSTVTQWLASLASNHRLSPLCEFDSHKWIFCGRVQI